MEQKRKEIFKRRVESEPFARKMGMRLIEVDEGRAVIEMSPDEGNLNILGMTHGGAIFSLMDEAFEISSNSHGTVAVALNMSVTYHQAPKADGPLRAESRELHRSRKTATYEIKVTDEKNTLIASCSALVYRKKQELPFLSDT